MTSLEPGQQIVGRPRSPLSVTVERVADGVWVMRGGYPPGLVHRIMNIYLIEHDGGLFMFDAGIRQMTPYVRSVAERMGGLTAVVLGHSHGDHRGTAPGAGAPVWCHEAEREYAEADNSMPYFDYSKLPAWTAAGPLRVAMPILNERVWDGGPVRVERTLSEGDSVAGFEVVHLPGHAPGLIGLWRERDRLALTSDCFYMLDVTVGQPSDPILPHDAYNLDSGQARESIRKLARLEPRLVCPGHVGPLREDVVSKLEAAAS